MNKISPYISLEGSPYADKILTDTQLDMILWEDDIQSQGPGTFSKTTQIDIDIAVKQLSGKTIKEYSHWRWPDNPEEQFLIVLQDLSHIEPQKGDVYAVYNYKHDSIIKDITFKQAQSMASKSSDYFVIPMDALNKK